MRIGTLTNIWRSMGYQAWAFHTGATRTSSWTPWECTRDRTLPIMLHGGLAYNFSGRVFQSWVKASVAATRGSGFQLTNIGGWDDSLLANSSVDNGPRRWLISWDNIGESFHSDLSDQILDSSSAIVFRTPENEGEYFSPCITAAGSSLVETMLVMLSPPSVDVGNCCWVIELQEDWNSWLLFCKWLNC